MTVVEGPWSDLVWALLILLAMVLIAIVSFRAGLSVGKLEGFTEGWVTHRDKDRMPEHIEQPVFDQDEEEK